MPIEGGYKWKRQFKGQCARTSYRMKATRGGMLRFCCPKGKWRKGRCAKGQMKLQAKGTKVLSRPLSRREAQLKRQGRKLGAYPLVKNITKVSLRRR